MSPALMPTTIGALLAEECTLDPYSPLPSFLERIMMEEAALSMDHVFESACQQLLVEPRESTTNSVPNIWVRFQRNVANRLAQLVQAYGPELKFVIKYAMERQCLQRVNATIAESMYGARRAKVGHTGLLSEITDRERTRLALLLTLSTYLKERLDRVFHSWRQQGPQTPAGQTSKVRSRFVSLYPFLHMTREGTIVFYQFLYLLNFSKYFDPLSHGLGLVVRRVTSSDIKSPPASSPSGPSSTTSVNSPSSVETLMIPNYLLYGGSTLFALGWISRFQRFLRQRNTNAMFPPPPEAPKLHLDPKQRIRLSSDPRICPLCQQPRIHPVASTSGHVFCYRCLLGYFRSHTPNCPLTGRECRENQIIRLYEPITQGGGLQSEDENG